MRPGIETVEELTHIIERQAAIIRELYSVVQQLNATTDLAPDIAEIQRRAAQITGSPED